MNYLAHVGALGAKSTDGWSWSDPVGLGIFMVAVALTLAILAWTIKTLASIDEAQKRRK